VSITQFVTGDDVEFALLRHHAKRRPRRSPRARCIRRACWCADPVRVSGRPKKQIKANTSRPAMIRGFPAGIPAHDVPPLTQKMGGRHTHRVRDRWALAHAPMRHANGGPRPTLRASVLGATRLRPAWPLRRGRPAPGATHPARAS
jgi:hypothetical protein